MSSHESSCPLASDATTSVSTSDVWPPWDTGTSSCPPYPSALLLRLRVLQVVCGILALVMGAVAAIEERGQVNLMLAIPAGAMTILAAAVSIHRSRGFSGYVPSPSTRAAVVQLLLWAAAVALHGMVLVAAGRTLVEAAEDITAPALAVALVALSAAALGAVLATLIIEWRHDPA